MAELAEPLNIDDPYKTDEKSSSPLISSGLTISLYLIALSESTLQASTSDPQHLECRQQIIPRHLIGPIISKTTLQASTSDPQNLKCRQQIIPPHPIGLIISEPTQQVSTSDPQYLKRRQQIISRSLIGSDYERQLSKSDIKAEPPEPLNIDDSSKFEEELSLPDVIFKTVKTLESSTSEITERMLHFIEEMRRILPPTWRKDYRFDTQCLYLRRHTSTSNSCHLEFFQGNIVELDHESQSYKSDITPEPPEPLNIDDSSDEDSFLECLQRIKMPKLFEAMQLSTSDPRHLESSQEDVVELDLERLSSKSDIMTELTEPLNIEDSSKSEEESSPSSISRPLTFLQHTYDSTSSSPAIMPSDDQTETHSRDSQSRQKKTFCKFTIECISFIIFLILSLILYLYFPLHIYQNDKRNNTITFPTAAIEMEKGILGQDQIVQVLTEYLQDSPLLKVVALIGDTSVEKSYTVDLIKKKFRRRSDNGFSSLYPNFVVLENLRAEHLTDVINYVKTFEEAYGNRQITILAVFKVGQIDDSTMRNTDLNRIINTVKDTFIEANISIKIISYEPLTENALEKHIINTAKDIRLTFSQDEINIIKRGLTEDNTDSRKAYGL